MSMNIKNKETQRLAKKLAEVTGETLTGAITEALRERLERRRVESGDGLAERLLKIGKDCAERLKEPYRTADHGELLYDEKGLPK
jgi:antitoxin VapB